MTDKVSEDVNVSPAESLGDRGRDGLSVGTAMGGAVSPVSPTDALEGVKSAVVGASVPSVRGDKGATSVNVDADSDEEEEEDQSEAVVIDLPDDDEDLGFTDVPEMPDKDTEDLSGKLIGSILNAKGSKDPMLVEAYSTLSSGDILRGVDWGIWKSISAVKAAAFIPTAKFIKKWLSNNRKLVDYANHKYIELDDYKPVAGDKIAGFIASTVSRYNELREEYKNNTIDDFHEAFEEYRLEYAKNSSAELFQNGIRILTEGIKIGRKFISGYQDASDYVRQGLSSINGTVESNNGESFFTMKDQYERSKVQEDSKKHYLITEWKGIPSLTKVTGGIMSGMLISILAPMKSGKTKMITRMCHNTILNNFNATVIPLEGSPETWTAQMRAIHFDYYYNTGVTLEEMKTGVDQETILMDRFASDKLRSLESVSYNDMVNNDEFGSVDYVNADVDVSNLLDTIDMSVKRNNSSIVFIDYTQQLSAGNTGMSKREVLAEIYPELLKYANKNNVTIVSPVQYTQEAIKDLNKTGVENKDLRTAGGESSEIGKSSDFMMGLWASPEELNNGEMKIVSIPSRFTKVFDPIDLAVDLGVCSFVEREDK